MNETNKIMMMDACDVDYLEKLIGIIDYMLTLFPKSVIGLLWDHRGAFIMRI